MKTHGRRAMGAMAAGMLLAAAGVGVAGAGGVHPRGDGGETLTVWTYYTTGGQIDALDAQNELSRRDPPRRDDRSRPDPVRPARPCLLAGAATGDGPDVVLDNVVVDFPTLAASGALLDLTPYWDAYPDAGQFPDSAVWSTPDGIYNVMSYTNLLAMFYNQEALDEYGITPPTTIDELATAMATVAEGGDYTPLAMSGLSNPEGAWMFMPLLLSQGIGYCNLDADATEAAFTTLCRTGPTASTSPPRRPPGARPTRGRRSHRVTSPSAGTATGISARSTGSTSRSARCSSRATVRRDRWCSRRRGHRHRVVQ